MTKRLQHIITILLLMLMVCSGKAWGQTVIMDQSFISDTETNTLPDGWTEYQYNGEDTPRFSIGENGAVVNKPWKQNALDYAISISNSNNYTIVVETYANVADQNSILYLSSSSYSLCIGNSYNSNSNVYVGSISSAASGNFVSYQTGTGTNPTILQTCSTVDVSKPLTYTLNLNGKTLTGTVSDGTNTDNISATISTSYTFDRIGMQLDGANTTVGVKSITVENKSLAPVVSTTISNNAFASTTKWYMIKLKGKYLSYNGTDFDNTATVHEYTPANLFAFTNNGTGATGYSIYNMQAGATKKIYMNVPTDDGTPILAITDAAGTWTLATDASVGYYMYEKYNGTNYYMNSRSDKLSFYTGLDEGCTLEFEEVTQTLKNLITTTVTAVNNNKGTNSNPALVKITNSTEFTNATDAAKSSTASVEQLVEYWNNLATYYTINPIVDGCYFYMKNTGQTKYARANGTNLQVSANLIADAVFVVEKPDGYADNELNIKSYTKNTYVQGYVSDNAAITLAATPVKYTYNQDFTISESDGTSLHRYLHNNNSTSVVGWEKEDANSHWSIKMLDRYTCSFVNVPDGYTAGLTYASSSDFLITGSELFAPYGTSLSVGMISASYIPNYKYSVQVNKSAKTITVTYSAVTSQNITSLADITDMGGYYILDNDITLSGNTTFPNDFTGTLDGNYHTVSGLTQALFNTVNGGTVKNLILDNVTITGTGNTGAIANNAKGNARIYNCGVLATGSTYDENGNVQNYGSIITGTNTGSIVGQINENTRVINCFSYASVSGEIVGGIVGNRSGTAMARTNTTNFTPTPGQLIFNCAFFGKVSGTSKTYPVFGGSNIDNRYTSNSLTNGINTYNYFLYDGTATYTDVNSANATMEKSYFTRFNLYSSILNSHRDLCAMYINNTQTLNDDMRHDIALWQYDHANRSTVPYLHLEKLVTNTKRTLEREIPNTTEDYKGKSLGSVSCIFHINGSTFTQNLPMTDMNTDTWDYTWGKIILPFANEFSGWSLPESGSTDYDKIITGWEITSISGGTEGEFSTTGDNAYNFADRDCTAKDIYTNNNYVWAQGGHYVVPTGVTDIEFTAHIANAYYLCDPYLDVSYSSDYKITAYIGTQLSGDTYNGKTVYHTLTDVYKKMEDKQNPADQAIVLVGNYHINTYATSGNTTDKNVWPIANSSTITYQKKASTIMSIDADNNQVPDYALVSALIYSTGRAWCPPLRFDFVCCPGLGDVSYTRAGCMANISILHSQGWFETTETSYLYFEEYEVRPQGFYYSDSPLIINGGRFQRIADGSNLGNSGNNNKFAYFKLGGKVYVKEFKPGHLFQGFLDISLTAKPVNVCGGQIDECSMTSRLFYNTKSFISGNANFFCSGGYIKMYVGADQGQLKGDVTAKIDHALIDEFYGGGNVANYGTAGQITGNITTTIKNSYVKFFVAGPKFGDMATDKVVTTSATNTIFGEYYGAGYGGTSLVEVSALPTGTQNPRFGTTDVEYNRAFTYYTNNRLTYEAQYGTVVGYRFRFNVYAGGGVPGSQNGVSSFMNKYATLSLASTNSVSSTLSNCTIEDNFYGGGCQGMVNGTITNTLTGCTVGGSVFGGGYKASVTPIYVYPTTQPTYSVFKAQLGLFTPFGTVEPEVYSWIQSTVDGTKDETNKTITTTVNMANMGKVTGKISTTVTDGTVGASGTGSVFGGGNESPSGSDTEVKILGDAVVNGNVYGGGNMAEVGGTTKIQIGDECITE